MTREELDYIVSKLIPVVIERLEAQSQGISEIEMAHDLTGVSSLPAIKRIGGTEKVVEVALSALSTPVDQAVSECMAAADKANQGAALAEQMVLRAEAALEQALTALGLVDDAVQTAREVTQEARQEIAECKTVQDETRAAADRLNTLSDHRDEIVQGYWWRWNEKTGLYENTGQLAKGNIMFATFKVDPKTGKLYSYTDPEYTGPQFILTNGNLNVTI